MLSFYFFSQDFHKGILWIKLSPVCCLGLVLFLSYHKVIIWRTECQTGKAGTETASLWKCNHRGKFGVRKHKSWIVLMIINNLNFRSPRLGDSQLLAHRSPLRGIFWPFCGCWLWYLHDFPDVSWTKLMWRGSTWQEMLHLDPRHQAFKPLGLGFMFQSLFPSWILFLSSTNVLYFNCQNYF